MMKYFEKLSVGASASRSDAAGKRRSSNGPRPRAAKRMSRSGRLTRLGGLGSAGMLALGITACGSSSKGGSALASPSCKPAHTLTTMHKGALTVSTYNYPPSTVLEGSGKLGGIEGAMLTKIAKEECLKLNILVQSAAGVIPAVQSGRADVAAGDWTLTKPRVAAMSHTIPFYNESMVLVSKGGVAKQIPQLKAMSTGTAQGNFWNDALNSYLGGTLKQYQSDLLAFQDALDGRLQVVVDGLIGATQYFKDHPRTPLKLEVPRPLAGVPGSQHEQKVFYIANRNSATVKAFNADIKQMLQSGYVRHLIKQAGLPAVTNKVSASTVLQ